MLVVRQVDHTHPAFTKLRFEGVTIESLPDHREGRTIPPRILL
jgi:hypothetical protein